MVDNPETQILLVYGIPGSGKSTYAQWLKSEKGFVHMDVDKPWASEHVDLKILWDHMFKTGSVEPFIKASSQIRGPVVLDWNFPPPSLHIVRALQQHGIEIWWFDGDRTAAQDCLKRRGNFLPKAYKVQMHLIEQYWPVIKSTIGLHIIETVKAGPSYMLNEEIYNRMLGSSRAQPMP